MTKNTELVHSRHHPLVAGQVMVASWGYSMTIVDFYLVRRITPKGAYLSCIGSRHVSGDGWQGKVDPDLGSGQGGQFFRRVDAKGRCQGHNSSAHARPWDGNPVYFNHMD